MKKYLFFIVFILLMISCTKDAVCENDTVKPVIQLAYPTDNPNIPAGEPLCMKVSISDDKSLMNVWLQVNDGHGFKKEYPITGRSMDIIEKYTAPPGVKGNLKATFFAVDESGNLNSKEISFSVNN